MVVVVGVGGYHHWHQLLFLLRTAHQLVGGTTIGTSFILIKKEAGANGGAPHPHNLVGSSFLI